LAELVASFGASSPELAKPVAKWPARSQESSLAWLADVTGAGFGAGCETFCRNRAALSYGLVAPNTNAIAQSYEHDGAPRSSFERTWLRRGAKSGLAAGAAERAAKSAALPLCSSTR